MMGDTVVGDTSTMTVRVTDGAGQRLRVLRNGVEAAVVNSSHHQAVADPGRLTVTGRAQDGTIEVCEATDDPFTIGVQWHPERTPDDKATHRLFEEFVRACQK